jgi:hypothetical protein
VDDLGAGIGVLQLNDVDVLWSDSGLLKAAHDLPNGADGF